MPAVDTFETPVTIYYPDEKVARGAPISPNGIIYYLRAWDTGTNGYVHWGPFSSPSENLTPSASQTNPNYTGTLQNPHVYYSR